MFSQFFPEGLYHSLRFSLMKRRNPIRTIPGLLPRTKAGLRVDKEAAIVVVGIGVAAATLLRGLKQHGYPNVTILARDRLYGGKCLNHGCMPAEYFHARRNLKAEEFNEQLPRFIGSLRSKLANEFKSFNYPFLDDELVEVRGKTVHLAHGISLGFDRLVLATGNRTTLPPYLGETFPVERFWELDRGRLVIVTDNNVSSLSYADMAAERGMKVTVLFEYVPVTAHLPSFQYFVQDLRSRGIQIIFESKIVGKSPSSLRIRAAGTNSHIPFDFLIYNGTSEPNLPRVDGKTPSLFHLDFKSASLGGRKNIYLLGDAAGFISATEAEFHARKVLEMWVTGEPVSCKGFAGIPLRIHAQKPLAMVGNPWTFFQKRWQSIDFKVLAWSDIDSDIGKLWYRYNKEHNKLEGIHICHREAGALISLASVLMELPFSDSHWTAAFVHPSASEIFKVLAERIEAENKSRIFQTASCQPTVRPGIPATLYLPPPSELLAKVKELDIFSREELIIGLLDPNPTLYFAILWGVKILAEKGAVDSISISRSKDGRYQCNAGKSFTYDSVLDSGSVSINMDGRTITVLTGPMGE